MDIANSDCKIIENTNFQDNFTFYIGFTINNAYTDYSEALTEEFKNTQNHPKENNFNEK